MKIGSYILLVNVYKSLKDTPDHGKGYIQFGTEVVNSKDHSVIALLGESPGASTSVSVALEVLEKLLRI